MGVKLGGASRIYSLPAVFFRIIGQVGFIAPAVLEGIQTNTYPYSIPSSDLIGLQFIGMFGGMAFFAVGMLLALLLWIILPPMLAHVAATNSFRAAFRLGEWWRVFRANLGGFLIAMILTAGLYMGVMLTVQILYFTIVLCILVPFLMAFVIGYLLIVANVLFAQAYGEAIEKLEIQTS